METRPMSADEARAEIAKRYGSYEDYRKDALNHERPIEKVEKAEKSEQEKFLDSCRYVAKARGQTLEQYLRENSGKYEQLRKLSYASADAD